MAGNLTEDKVRLITHQTIEKRNDDLLQKLPDALKPCMYEVAEHVANRTEAKIGDILSVDVNDPESKRELRDDLSHLRKSRQRREKITNRVLISLFIVPLSITIGWVLSWLKGGGGN